MAAAAMTTVAVGEERASSFTVIAMPTTGERFERAVAIMARLRAPGGCPWDREQTFDTIKPYTLEETYEVLEAIDLRDWEELSGELGDLLAAGAVLFGNGGGRKTLQHRRRA